MSTKMEKEELLELVVGYKKSSAVIAAYETGIFECLRGKTISLQELGEKKGMDTTHLSVFLLYLSSMNLVAKEAGKWKLTGEMESVYEQLCALEGVIRHEKNIFQRWMYPERVIQSLNSGTGNRDFDRLGFSPEEIALYDRTMYGSSLKMLAVYIFRKIRQCKNPSILEYGRSGDALLKAIKKTGYRFCGYYMEDKWISSQNARMGDGGFQRLEESDGQKFDFIFLYNTIHYFNEEVLRDRIRTLEGVLTEDGRIFIIDLFFQKGDAFLSNVLLDWLTHGGVYSLTKGELEEKWKMYGSLQLIQSEDIKEINSSILMIGRT